MTLYDLYLKILNRNDKKAILVGVFTDSGDPDEQPRLVSLSQLLAESNDSLRSFLDYDVRSIDMEKGKIYVWREDNK